MYSGLIVAVDTMSGEEITCCYTLYYMVSDIDSSNLHALNFNDLPNRHRLHVTWLRYVLSQENTGYHLLENQVNQAVECDQ